MAAGAPQLGKKRRSRAFFRYGTPDVLFGGNENRVPSAETWEYDGTTWTKLQPLEAPQARAEAAVAYHAARRKLVLFGGVLAAGTVANDTWVFRFDHGGPEEACVTGLDGDGDGLVGCADPDCWDYCTPHCPQAATTCDASLPHCGDGECVPIETKRLCPEDCGDPQPLCGDHLCEGDETDLSCPGDCPP